VSEKLPAAAGGEQRRRLEYAALAVIVVVFVVAFFWTGRWMLIRWNAENSYYTHGYLIPIVSAVLLYFKRHDLAVCRRRPCGWGALLLVPAILIHLLGTALQVGFLSGFAMLGVLAGLVLLLFGPQVFRLALFPIAFLAFMAPLPFELVDKASFNMKLLSAYAAEKAVSPLEIPLIREGSIIRLVGGTLEVGDVCSGLKYLISLTAFAALYAYISKVKWWGKLVLFGLSIPIAFIANAVRVSLMVIVGEFVSIKATQSWYFHDFFGFALFIFAFITLFMVESLLLRQFRWPFSPPRSAPADAEREEDVSDDESRKVEKGERVPPSRLFYFVVCAALSVTAALSVFLALPRGVAARSDALRCIPLALDKWQGADYQQTPRVYEILGTEDVVSRVYRMPGDEPVQLLVVMAQQARRRSHPPEHCLRGEGYTITDSRKRSVSPAGMPGGRALEIRELVISRRGRKRMTWYFFKSGDRLTTSYWAHQIGVALRKIRNANAADILVRIDTSVPGDDLNAGRQRLRRFLDAVWPSLMEHLP